MANENDAASVSSSSAVPALNETMRSLSLCGASAIPKETRSQSLHRESIGKLHSAVPDSVDLNPVCRPDKGGTIGEKITVFTNHFQVHIENATIYQYDIDIVMIDLSGKARPIRKDERWNIIQAFIKETKNFPTVW